MLLPKIREPMAATQIAKPFHRPGWIYEEKYDGWWMLAYKDGNGGAARQPCRERSQPAFR
jgi:ATP-dependent DNA ligase